MSRSQGYEIRSKSAGPFWLTFALNHVMVVPDPLSPFRFDFTVTGA